MGHRRTSYLERLANLDQDELLYEFAHAEPRRKSAALALLLPEDYPTRETLLRCGTPKNRYDKAGRRIPGLYRCKLPECTGCQMRASGRASRRVNALVAAATLGAPDRDTVSFVTVNRPDHDLAGFKAAIRGALKGTKGTARFQVGLTGLLHAHMIVIHEGHTRSDLKARLKEFFTQARAVNGKKIEQEWLLDGVVAVTRYSMKPVKTRDFHRETPVSVEMVHDWVRVQNQIKGSRKMDWGFTQAERGVARDLIKKMKPKRMVKKRKKVNIQVYAELGFTFGIKSTLGWNVRLDAQGECDWDYSIYSEMNVNCPIWTLDQGSVPGGDTVIHTDLGKYPYTVVITGSPQRGSKWGPPSSTSSGDWSIIQNCSTKPNNLPKQGVSAWFSVVRIERGRVCGSQSSLEEGARRHLQVQRDHELRDSPTLTGALLGAVYEAMGKVIGFDPE